MTAVLPANNANNDIHEAPQMSREMINNKIYQKYQRLGKKSKHKQKMIRKNYAKYGGIMYNNNISLYDELVQKLSIKDLPLNPSKFIDFIVYLTRSYVGSNQIISIFKQTCNVPLKINKTLSLSHIDLLIPIYSNKMKLSLPNNENKDNSENIYSINYSFGVLEDIRIISQTKCNPYVLNDKFEWTIVNNAVLTPNKKDKKLIGGCLLIEDELNVIVYGNRKGLYYNDAKSGKVVTVLDTGIEAIWRQYDSVFVLQKGPKLYDIKLKSKQDRQIEYLKDNPCIVQLKNIFSVPGMNIYVYCC